MVSPTSNEGELHSTQNGIGIEVGHFAVVLFLGRAPDVLPLLALAS